MDIYFLSSIYLNRDSKITMFELFKFVHLLFPYFNEGYIQSMIMDETLPANKVYVYSRFNLYF